MVGRLDINSSGLLLFTNDGEAYPYLVTGALLDMGNEKISKKAKIIPMSFVDFITRTSLWILKQDYNIIKCFLLSEA